MADPSPDKNEGGNRLKAEQSRHNRPGGNLINVNQRKQLEAIGAVLPTRAAKKKRKSDK